ncbi:MAG: hypothetical protein WAW79_06400 [Steroidobacteraceae bacterium]
MRFISNSRVFHAFIALVGASCAWQAQADSYTYQLVDHPGTAATQVFGINNKGSVVGNGFDALNSYPFVYDSKKGTYTTVAPAAGYFNTHVLGINEAGVMVGRVDTSADGSTSSAFIRGKDGSFTVFSHPDAASFTEARGVNNTRLVSGWRDSSTGETVGFVYDSRKGTFTDIVPSLATIAQGINARGDVVGSATFPIADDPCPPSAGGTARYGWLRTKDGTVTYFDVNGGRTSARGITDSGTIAGFVTDVTGVTKSFVVTLDGSQCQSITVADADLLEFPGHDTTFAGGISNPGVVVGATNDPSGTSHGFIAKKVK